jgi:hypothetical protein
VLQCCCAVLLCYAVLYCCAVLLCCTAVLCRAVLHCAVLSVLHCTVLYYLCCTALFCTVLYFAVFSDTSSHHICFLSVVCVCSGKHSYRSMSDSQYLFRMTRVTNIEQLVALETYASETVSITLTLYWI